jgi:hypothetical protein
MTDREALFRYRFKQAEDTLEAKIVRLGVEFIDEINKIIHRTKE